MLALRLEDPTPPSVDPLIRAGGRALAEEFETHAASLGATFSRFEQACLDIGAGLGEAVPGLADLATMFDALSGALESGGIDKACADLATASADLTQAAGDLIEEGRALIALVDADKQIGTYIDGLLDCIHAMSALVFMLKIKSASMREHRDDMAAFTERLQDLAQNARRALSDYRDTHAKLDEVLRAATQAQADFQRTHREGLELIAADIRSGLGAVAERRRRTAEALHEVSARTREISDRISQCVCSLQVGDSTRQRVEHAQAALHFWTDLTEGRSSRLVDDETRELFASQGEAFTSRLCRLQARQLEGAYGEFHSEMETISQTLPLLAGEAGALAGYQRELFGAEGSNAGSFLETLEKKLTAARDMVDACRRARAVVDNAARAVVTTMDDLRRRTDGLHEIVVDVTIIGTNALLRSTRLGDRGKGISLIAQELRANGEQIGKGIQSLPPALNRVVAYVEHLAQSGQHLKSGRLAELDERMSAAIRAFGANGQQMSEALTRLDSESDGVRAVLDRAVAALAGYEDTGPTLLAAAEAMDEIAARLSEVEDWSEIDLTLDRRLRPLYTMASERRIHEGLTGCDAEVSQAQASSSGELAELLHALIFRDAHGSGDASGAVDVIRPPLHRRWRDCVGNSPGAPLYVCGSALPRLLSLCSRKAHALASGFAQ